MHMKKNVFGNTIGLLLKTASKAKDTLKSRQDLVAMKIRQDLHLVDKENGRYVLAPTNITTDCPAMTPIDAEGVAGIS